MLYIVLGSAMANTYQLHLAALHDAIEANDAFKVN